MINHPYRHHGIRPSVVHLLVYLLVYRLAYLLVYFLVHFLVYLLLMVCVIDCVLMCGCVDGRHWSTQTWEPVDANVHREA